MQEEAASGSNLCAHHRDYERAAYYKIPIQRQSYKNWKATYAEGIIDMLAEVAAAELCHCHCH